MTISTRAGAAIGIALTFLSGTAAAEGDAENGKVIFERKCDTCHTLEPGDHKVGPSLAGVAGQQAGTSDGYRRYSADLVAAGQAGLVWTPETIASFAVDPQKFIKEFAENAGMPGRVRSNMTYKLRKEDEAADVAAYLQSLSQ